MPTTGSRIAAAFALVVAGCASHALEPCGDPAPVATIALQHADARDVAAWLNQLERDSERAARARGCVLFQPGFEFVPPARTPRYAARDRRTLAVNRVEHDEHLEQLRELVARLDVPLGDDE